VALQAAAAGRAGRKHGGLETIDQIGGYMEGQTICALSDAAAWAATGFLRRFRPEFEAHVREGRCPLPESFEA
jgi:NADH:ubiquinone oxidoreductase subunit F (NADH-binding)